MKIRNGFVSNSSSSSFIVAFPHKPADPNDILYMLNIFPSAHLSYDYEEEISEDDPTWEETAIFLYGLTLNSQLNTEDNYEIFHIMKNRYYHNDFHYSNSIKTDARCCWGYFGQPFFAIDGELFMKYINLELERKELNKKGHMRDDFDEYIHDEGGDFVRDSKVAEALRKLEKEIEELIDEMAKKDLEAFKNIAGNSFITIFEFGDSHGIQGRLGSRLENCKMAFENVLYIKVSNH
jgi:predicted transcriptional regulator